MTSSQALWALLAIFVVQAVTDSAVLALGRRQLALQRALPFLVSGAAGVLLATACLDLLPAAVQSGSNDAVVWQVLLGSLLAFFCLEAFMHDLADRLFPETVSALPRDGVHPAVASMPTSTHLHGHRHSSRVAPLLLGSALHSTVDGVAIGAAFAAGGRPGVSAAVAVGLHELPHRLGDFSLLLHNGMPRRQAAQWAIGAGAMAFLGGLAVVLFGQHADATRWLLPVSAASFLYIALVDLVPELQARREGGRLWWEVVCLIGGAALIAAAVHLPGE